MHLESLLPSGSLEMRRMSSGEGGGENQALGMARAAPGAALPQNKTKFKKNNKRKVHSSLGLLYRDQGGASVEPQAQGMGLNWRKCGASAALPAARAALWLCRGMRQNALYPSPGGP